MLLSPSLAVVIQSSLKPVGATDLLGGLGYRGGLPIDDVNGSNITPTQAQRLGDASCRPSLQRPQSPLARRRCRGQQLIKLLGGEHRGLTMAS